MPLLNLLGMNTNDTLRIFHKWTVCGTVWTGGRARLH